MNVYDAEHITIPNGKVKRILDRQNNVLWQDADYGKFYLTNDSNSPINVSIRKEHAWVSAADDGAPTISLEISDDGITWTTLGDTSSTALSFSIPKNGRKYLRSISANAWGGYYLGEHVTNKFSSTGRFGAHGNIMELLGYSELKGIDCMAIFQGCTSLTTAPTLPATTLAKYCYRYMFWGCTALTVAPELPATTLAEGCYGNMFEGCTSLTVAPSLPATTLAKYCYAYMFNGCTSLTSASLPATTLEYDCYAYMFNGCTSLTSAPSLPATTLARGCYASMFRGCTALTKAPELPATTLDWSCYAAMFQGCTSLTKAPELPATTLAWNCYQIMFDGCTSLTSAPSLPATTLVGGCYDGMFSGCRNLSEIRCNAINIRATACTNMWVRGVAASGTFYKNASMNDWPTGEDGIPSGWTVQNLYKPFYLTNDDVNPVTVSITKNNANAPTISLQVSDDAVNWTTLGDTSTTPLDIVIPVGGRKYLRSVTDSGWGEGNYYNSFSCTGLFGAHGSIMSLLGYDTLKGDDCYHMFHGCTSLTSTPELPATTLAQYCYAYMFRGCTALTVAPELPATTLANYCYGFMFYKCTSLTTAPALPATVLANACYDYMFRECTSLTTTPALPATTLVKACYSGMFYGCSNLTSVTCNATDISAIYCVNGWLYDVAAAGTFYKNASMNDWPTGEDGIPSGWTVQNL